MRANIPTYEMKAASSLAEALAHVADGWQPFAGGTDVMVLLEAGVLKHQRFTSLWKIAELKGITEGVDGVSLGALTTYAEIRRHARVARDYPMLADAARETGALAIQSRGTIGGNIANASPAADTPPALLVYDAELELVSPKGSRRVRYADFHRGYKQTALAPGELIHRVHLKTPPAGSIHRYRKVGTRKAQAISKVCLASLAQVSGPAGARVIGDLRLAFGSVAPVPIRCRKTEAAVRGAKVDAALIAKARAALAAEIAPIDDIRSTREYRLAVAQNLLQDLLQTL